MSNPPKQQTAAEIYGSWPNETLLQMRAAMVQQRLPTKGLDAEIARRKEKGLLT